MNGLAARLRSSIGRKLVVAVSGLALLGFVIVHLLGNLQVFLGPDALNGYAQKLRDLGPVLWVLRGGLLVFAVLHVVLTLRIAAENRAARPVRYAVQASVQSKASTRSMLLTGCMLLLFVLYHLAHFTWGLAHPEFSGHLDGQGRHDVYRMVVESFRVPLISGLYIAAMLLLGLHLGHGVSSVFQTFGWNHSRYNRLLQGVGPVLGAFIVVGNCSIPIAVLLGLVERAGGGA